MGRVRRWAGLEDGQGYKMDRVIRWAGLEDGQG